MVKLEWEESWSVNDDSIDRDHKALIDIINRISDSREKHKPTGRILEELADYVDYHFTREEQMLRSANYEEFDSHIAEHRRFTEWLKNVKTAFELNPETEGYVADAVTEYLKEWLRNHVLHTDMAYKEKI